MVFRLFDWLIPAEGEFEVRTYHCTTLKSRLLNLNAEGYLVVSNKRVLFHGFGSTFAGESILQSEVPVEDVSGITCFSGIYFSVWHFIGAFFLTLIVGILVNSIIIAGIIGFLADNLNDYQSVITFSKILLWFLSIASIILSFFILKERILRPVVAGSAVFFFMGLSGLDFLSNFIGIYFGIGRGSEWVGILAFIALIYALICMYWYARRPTMSIIIGSKGGSSTPIAISGVRSFGMGGGATRSLTAEPAEDVEAMIKQLGAMITDIQKLGDLGIQKWRIN